MMRDFVYHNPTRIIFGAGTVDRIGAEAAACGRKVLLVYGMSSSKRSGLLDQVARSLADAGVEVCEHGGVRSNPVLSHVRAGIVRAKEERVELIVALGGGSVIDSAKAIAAGVPAEHDVWQFFTGQQPIRSALPLLTILTLAAAGSEMNGGMVVTNEETAHKFGVGSGLLNPKVSILDPTLTYSVPPSYTAYGGVDAIAHALEFYFTTEDPATPVQDRLIEGLMVNIMASTEQSLAMPDGYQGRADLMWCAALALCGLPAAGLGPVGFPMHLIEHSLSALYNVPHGAGLAVVMPGWMSYQAKSRPEKFAQLGERVLGVRAATAGEQAKLGITRFREWLAASNCPTRLRDLEIPETDIPAIAANVQGLAKVWGLDEYTPEKVTEILRLCC